MYMYMLLVPILSSCLWFVQEYALVRMHYSHVQDICTATNSGHTSVEYIPFWEKCRTDSDSFNWQYKEVQQPLFLQIHKACRLESEMCDFFCWEFIFVDTGHKP